MTEIKSSSGDQQPDDAVWEGNFQCTKLYKGRGKSVDGGGSRPVVVAFYGNVIFPAGRMMIINKNKVMVTTKYGIITGLVAATYDIMMYSHATGLGPMMKRYALHTVPLGLMGATFAIVANGVQHAREKDDGLNYFLGGLACGPILAAYLGNGHAVLLGGLALGAVAYIKKDAVDQGVCLFPTAPGHMNHINSWRNDYTLCKDPRDEMQHTCGLSNK